MKLIHLFSIYLFQIFVMSIVGRKKIFIQSVFFNFTEIFFIFSLFDKYATFMDKLFKRNYKMNIIKYLSI